MKKACVLCFSDRGRAIAEKTADILRKACPTTVYERGEVKANLEALFTNCDALVFIGACGIAVRMIAPYVQSKTSDPAVIVMDERGKHVISLLSGHIGGANALALKIAEALGAEPVITTATDVNGRFSVDTWASLHDCAIDSMSIAKKFSAEILKRDLPMCSEFAMGDLPCGTIAGSEGEIGAYIGIYKREPFETTLRLIPRVVCLGVGCKRGTEKETIAAAVANALENAGIDERSIGAIASIDVKENEIGLREYIEEKGVRSMFFSAEQLNAAPGEYTGSAYVQKTVGTDNVCERSAVCAAGEGAQLILRKTAGNGVTVAAAIKKWSVTFE